VNPPRILGIGTANPLTGGRERTKAEFRALLDAADYKLTRIIPTMALQSVLGRVKSI
jgi:hypothetical protein